MGFFQLKFMWISLLLNWPLTFQGSWMSKSVVLLHCAGPGDASERSEDQLCSDEVWVCQKEAGYHYWAEQLKNLQKKKKKNYRFAPGSTSQGHMKWPHHSAPRHNPSAGLTSSNPKHCHGKGSQVSSRGCGFVCPASPELLMMGVVPDCIWPFQGI